MAKKKVTPKVESPKVDGITSQPDSIKISDYEKKIDQADSLITKIWSFLKNHWGKLIVLVLIYGGYKFCVLVGEEMDKPKQEIEVVPVDVIGKPYIVREYQEVLKDGSTGTIQVWSDSVETVK